MADRDWFDALVAFILINFHMGLYGTGFGVIATSYVSKYRYVIGGPHNG